MQPDSDSLDTIMRIFTIREIHDVSVKSRQLNIELLPINAYAVQFFSLEVKVRKGRIYLGSRKDVSPIYYIGADCYLIEDILAKWPKGEILADIMRRNGFNRILVSSTGIHFPLSPNDILLIRS